MVFEKHTHTPILVDGEEVKPLILVFLRSKHGYVIVEKHPIQAFIRDRSYIKTMFLQNI